MQRPAEKINHALLLGGAPGIGKDTILHPVRYAVGAWNFAEVTPVQLLGRFNGFIKSVILRINEARDLGEINRYAFYEHCKPLTAAPPEVLRCDEKNIREYSVPNVVGVIITSQLHDRRLLSAARRPPPLCRLVAARGRRARCPDYFEQLYRWYDDEGGNRHVAAWLRRSSTSPTSIAKAPPKKTRPSGKSSTPTAAPEKANSPMPSTRWLKPMAGGRRLSSARTAHSERCRRRSRPG